MADEQTEIQFPSDARAVITGDFDKDVDLEYIPVTIDVLIPVERGVAREDIKFKISGGFPTGVEVYAGRPISKIIEEEGVTPLMGGAPVVAADSTPTVSVSISLMSSKPMRVSQYIEELNDTPCVNGSSSQLCGRFHSVNDNDDPMKYQVELFERGSDCEGDV